MELSVGIIGIGNVGSAHATAIFGGKIKGMKLAAICDISDERKEWASKNCPNVPFFENADEFFANAKIDTLIIATPHYFHTVYAIRGFEKGFNVLTEKPAGVRVSDVKKMNEAAEKSGKVFGIMWNQRTNPMYKEVRRIVKEGILGKPQRLLWEATAWYRTQEYYDSGSWRATWLGEGGGVLMNQAPHQLDLMQWIFGMPDFVQAQCYVGKYHNIEVEDDAVISCRYSDGKTAIFMSSTGENPGTNRLEICGEKGKLIAEMQKLTLWLKNDKGDFDVTVTDFPDAGSQHEGVLQSFADAVISGGELVANGKEGINEITITNAAYLSAWTGEEVALPFDTEKFDELLEKRRKNSSLKATLDVHTGGEYEKRWRTLK